MGKGKKLDLRRARSLKTAEEQEARATTRLWAEVVNHRNLVLQVVCKIHQVDWSPQALVHRAEQLIEATNRSLPVGVEVRKEMEGNGEAPVS